jgi:hypothetical protein
MSLHPNSSAVTGLNSTDNYDGSGYNGGSGTGAGDGSAGYGNDSGDDDYDGDGGDGGGDGGGGDDYIRGRTAQIVQGLAAISAGNASGSTGTGIIGAGQAYALESAAASAAGLSTLSTEFEGARWNSKIVTWSFGGGSQFGSALSAQEQSIVEQALGAWAKASGLTFEQVSDSPQSDIRIGTGSFDTLSTGQLGYTSYQSSAGQFSSGVTAQVEDPNQTALTTGANGQLKYSGTDATFYQVVLHEIGHALGLGDDADPNSVMYYGSSSSNTQLDSTDVTEIQSLYGTAGSSSAAPSTVSSSPISSGIAGIDSISSVLQLAQALAVFNASADQTNSTPLSANTNLVVDNILAAHA